MRIAIDCRMFNSSGIGNVLKNILHCMPKEHEYLLIGNENDLSSYKTDKIFILACDIPIFSIKEFVCFPVKEVNRCDMFFSPNYNLPGRIYRPKICFIHDLVYLDMPELTSVLGFVIRYVYALRSVVISKIVFTVSEFSKNRIIHYFGHKKKIKTASNTVPLKLKENLSKFTKSIENYFIFVGNVKKHKGLVTLIKAFDLFPDKNTKLYIVGKKENFQTAFSEIEQQNNPNIIFTGWIDDKKVYSLMNNARALIQPSLYEGFGIPPLEALYLKTPVILSDIPVFKELYRNMPVVFFKCGDAEDLAYKMKDIVEINISPSVLDEQFSIKKTIKTIFSAFES